MATHIPSLRATVGARVVDPRELASAPRALVRFGDAPDGLPWLCDVDRSSRIDHLYATVCGLFDADAVGALPDDVRAATAGALARGLMGVHEVTLDGRAGRAFVSRQPARALFGPTLLEQALAPAAAAPPPPSSALPITAASAYGMHDALEEAIEASRSSRHVLLTLEGEAWTATVADAARALRTPAPPFRRVVFESLVALDGATAKLAAGYDTWRVPVADRAAYVAALTRAGEAPGGGSARFELPRATVMRVLVEVARLIGELHARGAVHGDLTPGNILLDGARPTAADALQIEVGQIATAATFAWAAPEQVVGRPLDPRADVFALGKMVCALVGAVPFGERIEYVVPTGGNVSRSVQLLKTDGVFLDAKALGVPRDWQLRWQDVLGRMLAYDRDRRPRDGATVAVELVELAERFPPPGGVELAGRFGALAPIVGPGPWPVARVIADG